MLCQAREALAEALGFLYFGQNKMVTRLNMETDEITFFTNKNDDEIAALVEL